jgi:hypothetical protein
MPLWKGRQYMPGGSPLTWFAKDDGSAASPEVAAELDLRHARKMMARTGIKPAGRNELKLTAGGRRRALCAQGHTVDEIADMEGVDADSVRRSMAPDRTAPDRRYRKARRQQAKSRQ